jgi:hypothetical protein
LRKDKEDAGMIQKVLFITVIVLVQFSIACTGNDSKPPRVVSTIPQNESRDVDPSISEISVKFNEEMMDQSWSWAYEDRSMFPSMVGQAYYVENNTRNILPVKLEPNKEYVIWINTDDYQNFRDTNGNPAVPFRFFFKTR